MYKQQARMLQMQRTTDQVNHQRQVAVDTAATNQESLERTKRLQRIIGSTISASSYAGLSVNSGLAESLNTNSMYESAVEEGISRSNFGQRMASLNLNAATQDLNTANQIQQARSSASSSMLKGIMGAAGSIGSFYQWNTALGKASA